MTHYSNAVGILNVLSYFENSVYPYTSKLEQNQEWDLTMNFYTESIIQKYYYYYQHCFLTVETLKMKTCAGSGTFCFYHHSWIAQTYLRNRECWLNGKSQLYWASKGRDSDCIKQQDFDVWLKVILVYGKRRFLPLFNLLSDFSSII